ncbi:MAG: phosphatase PAP2 family protein [Bdellovibrionales bacterium]|nr:phosphatase PAP2 family protein [Bdellovibrionales bacterium]
MVIAFAGIAAVLYGSLQLHFRDPVRLYLSKVLLGFVSYVIGHLIAVLLRRLRDIRQALSERKQKSWQETFRDYLRAYLSPGKLVHDLRLIHAISAMFVVYINLKHLIPYINDRLYDEPLMRFERLLLNGRSPGELLIELIGPSWAPLLSEGYTAFYPYVAFITVVMVLAASQSYAQRFCFAFCLLWFLAIIVEYALPTLGPCFYYPELFSHLPPTRVAELQQELWAQKLYLDAHPQSDKGVWLISGLPSLHIAAVVLGSIYLRKVSKVAECCSWLFLAVTCVTTVYFGWHYVADLPTAAFLAWLVHYLSGYRLLQPAGVAEVHRADRQ